MDLPEFDCPFPVFYQSNIAWSSPEETALFYVMRISSRIKSFVVNMKYKI
jgi:hypothetical protein